MQAQVIGFLTVTATILAVLADLVFIWAYAHLVPDWKSGPVSGAMIIWAGLVVLVLLSRLLHELLRPAPKAEPGWASWLDIALGFLIAAAAIWRTLVLWRAVRADEEDSS